VSLSLNSIFVKWVFLQIMLTLLSFSLFAQKQILEQKISLSVREEKLEDVLDNISEKTSTYFSYNSDLISENQRFTLNLKDKALFAILDNLLLGTSLQYKLINKQIIIFKKVKDQLKPNETISLFGTVRDAITKQPISGVNVFVSGTLKGNSTDQFGNFSIGDLKPNVFELVFSHVSYDIRLMTINAKHNKPTSFSLILIPKTIQLEEVEINALEEKNWNRHYYIFESEFLGNTINAAKCRILNSEVLSFDYDKQHNILTANSNQPLLIENHALGYDIQYFLQSFENNNSTSKIHGVMSFREKIPQSRREMRQWRKGRKRSYLGSYAHFLKAVYNNKLRKEGFKIYLADTIGGSAIIDIIENDILIDNINQDIEMKFKGFLKVEFVKAEYLTANEIIKAYYRTGNAIENGIQTSYIKLNTSKVTILKNGLLKEQFAITKYGYWSWERVAEYLPFEYKP